MAAHRVRSQEKGAKLLAIPMPATAALQHYNSTTARHIRTPVATRDAGLGRAALVILKICHYVVTTRPISG